MVAWRREWHYWCIWREGLVHNDIADKISRKDLSAVLADVSQHDLSARELLACEGAEDLMRWVWAEPQTAAG